MATEEVTREEPTVNYVSSVDRLLLIEEPIAGEFVGPLYQQPSLMAVDAEVRQLEMFYCTASVKADVLGRM